MFKELLKKKRVVVTGGAKGLGFEIVKELAFQGADVAFTYTRDEKGAEEALLKLQSLFPGNRFLCYKTCVTSLIQNQEMARDLRAKWEGLDIIINNAGISQFLPLALMEEEDWDKTMNINLKGIYITTKSLLPLILKGKKGGAILNIGSLAGVRILAAPLDYCSSKAGIKGFTESLSKEVGHYKIRVNCLAPGILEGGVARGIPTYKMNDYLAQLALHREGRFDEVAKCAAFLVSDKNSYMTGNTVIMDGGL